RIANVEVAAPLALAVGAGRHLAIRRHAERADEWRDRPGDAVAEVQGAVARRAAGAGGVAEHLRRVLPRPFRPAGRLAERTTPWPDRNPRRVGDHDLLNRHDKGIAALCPLDVNRAADRVDLRRAAVETGPQRRDRLVSRRLEVAGRGIVGLDLEGLARPHAQERLVPPVEGILAGLFAGDALHGSSGVR